MACSSPYYRQIRGEWLPLPCGRCPPCKKRRVDGWVFRLLQEDKVSTSAHFVTLTYDNESVPLSKNGFMTLTRGKEDVNGQLVDKCCFTKYIKRLRKLTDNKIKYYACGEYGSENLRPHWHAIIFNVPDAEMFFEAWKVDGKYFGKVVVGDVTGNSVAYVMKYIDKGPNSKGLFKGWRPFVGRDDRVKEFSLMSKGLGKNYITESVKKYHHDDLNRVYLDRDGVKIAMPRYYKEKIYDEDVRAELGRYAQLAAGKAESENYKLFLKNHKRSGITYEEFKDLQRTGVENRYLSQFNKRKL